MKFAEEPLCICAEASMTAQAMSGCPCAAHASLHKCLDIMNVVWGLRYLQG